MKKKIRVCLMMGLCLCLSGMLSIVSAATKTKTVYFSLGSLTAQESIELTVNLDTLNKPSVKYTKSGTNGMYNNVWTTYNAIDNTLTKSISADTATYTIKSRAQWIDLNRNFHYSGYKNTTFSYSGSLS